MDEDTLDARLRDAGLADTAAAWPVGATIRPPDLSTSETLPATSEPNERSLPRLSVDLRGSMPTDGPTPPPSTGADLEVRALLGEGGMGRVLLARQHSLQRDVAVKTAKDGAAPSVRDAILREGAITGQLEHPAIVPVHALGVDSDGRPAMVMKRVEGVSWDVLVKDPDHERWEGWEGDQGDRLPGHLQLLARRCVHHAEV